MSDPVEKKLFDAAWDGRASEVSSLLRDHPEINVNWSKEGSGWTSLHAASRNGRVEVVKLLLAHPNIDVNMKSSNGNTPFSLGCLCGQVSVVQVLLKDPRVNTTLDDNDGRTPLWYASFNGGIEVVEWLIASSRDLGDFMNKKGKDVRKDYTALEIARKNQRSEVVSVLERFIANPAQTRYELRVKLGVLDPLVSEVFALTVFLCDNLLQLKPAAPAITPTAAVATRFFTIIKRLPMELQMILCHCAVGSTKQNILRKDSEVAFKSLARILLDSQFEL